MARYDYSCPACNTTFEVEHGMKEHPEVVCPTCGGPCNRVFSASGIVLKGSGFYNTDQRGHKGPTEATGGKKQHAEHEAHDHEEASHVSDAGENDRAQKAPVEGACDQGGRGSSEKDAGKGGEAKHTDASSSAAPTVSATSTTPVSTES